MNAREPSLGESRPARVIGWFIRSRWSRIDGLVIFGTGWLAGSDHRIGSRIALLVVAMFGASVATDLVKVILARLPGARRPQGEAREH